MICGYVCTLVVCQSPVDDCVRVQVEQLLQGQEDSQGNINYENFVHLIMQG